MVSVIMRNIIIIVFICMILIMVIGVTNWHCSKNIDVSEYTKEQLMQLLHTGYQYAVMCEQDQNPIIALLHCCTAINYLESVQGVVSAAWVQKNMNNDIEHYHKALSNRINFIISHINKTYPNIATQSQYSPCAGWLFV